VVFGLVFGDEILFYFWGKGAILNNPQKFLFFPIIIKRSLSSIVHDGQ
jgi:hypothetical protein